MKYAYQGESIPQDKRKALNEKVLYLIDSGAVGNAPSARRISIMPIPAMAAFMVWNGRTTRITMHTARQRKRLKTASSLRHPACVNLLRPA